MSLTGATLLPKTSALVTKPSADLMKRSDVSIIPRSGTLSYTGGNALHRLIISLEGGIVILAASGVLSHTFIKASDHRSASERQTCRSMYILPLCVLAVLSVQVDLSMVDYLND